MKSLIHIIISVFTLCSALNAQLWQSHLISSSHPEQTESVIADFDADGINDIVIFENKQNQLI